jgi:thiol:disulfide interchange protein DsbD
MHGRATAIALLVVVVIAPALVWAQFRGPRAELSPLVESEARAGSTTRAALGVRLPPQLHVQSNAPRDPALIPTELTFNPPAGIRVTELVFPKATDFQQAGLPQPLAVFEHEFAIGIQFAVAEGTAPGTIDVPGRLRYQACDDKVCFPPQTAEVRWTLSVVGPAAATTRTRPDVFERIAFGTGSAPSTSAAAATAPERTFPAGSDGVEQLKDFTLVSTTGYSEVDEFLTFLKNAEAGVKEKGLFEGRGPLAILLLIFLGGLALNLTPCVLPMIPINLAIIGAGSKAGSRARGFLLGGVYGAAMAVVYGLLGVIVITTASTFGAINASPWFNLSIAFVFVVLALAMFDVVTIDFSRFAGSVGGSASGKGSVALAFGMGAIAALLAGACVAPVVIQVVLFSSDLYAQGTLIALALPFLLGVGMAVPWPLAGAGLTALPKPGPWMVRVKQAFGVFILATASYYGYLAYGLFADRWVDPKEVAASVEEKLKSGWHASLAEGLNVALLEQKPVLIDMWATWCKNCVVMDRTTLADPAVEKALDGYVKIKYQTEQLDEYPARALVERYKVIGLPTYLLLHPNRAPNFGRPQ